MNASHGVSRPVEPGRQAFDLVAGMENELAILRDFSTLIVMAAAGIDEVRSGEAQPALVRIGWLMRDYTDSLEAKRGEAFALLHGYAHPAPRVAA